MCSGFGRKSSLEKSEGKRTGPALGPRERSRGGIEVNTGPVKKPEVDREKAHGKTGLNKRKVEGVSQGNH